MKHALITAAVLALAAPLSWAQDAAAKSSILPGGLLVYGTVGTAGAGLGVGTQVADKWNVRAEMTRNSASVNQTSDNLDFKGSLNLESAGIYGDYFPFAGAFRMTGGVMFKAPNGDLKATLTAATDIGSQTGVGVAGDTVSATVKYPSTMPYLGIGWGFGALKEKGFKFGFDLGAGVGTLKSTLTTNIAAVTAADIAAEEKKLNDKLNKVSFFPIVKFSVGYSF